ncbi:MAG: TIGR03086 family metal-binding protein [Ilumatobacteraceae bacterium]
MTPTAQLEHIIPALSEVVHRIWHGQMEAPTPCAVFNVHDVIDHMIVVGGSFAPLFRGETPTEVTAPVVYGWVPASEFTETMSDLLAAVQSPGALDRTIPSPFGEVSGDTFARFVAFDGLIHGWDLARATGQTWAPPTELVEAVEAFARVAITPEMRDGHTFKDAKPAPADASPLDRLVAFSGRTA